MPCHRITVLLIATSLPFIGTAQVAPAPTAGVQAPPTSVQQVIPAQTNPTSDADSAASIDAPRAHLATQLPAVTPGNRPVIGLALEGGGALGLAHIGVLQWFEQNHIPIDRIAGTSMGALVGAFYATGHSPKQMREIAVSDEFARVFTLQTPYADSSYRRRQDRRQIPAVATIGLAHGAILRNSLLTNRGINEFLTAHLLAYNSRRIDYNQLPIPFRCVATDLNDFSPRIFGNGSLPQAVRASISIPGVFSPVEDTAGHYLVDGGIVNNLPADVVRNELHADKVIAIRIEDAPLAPSDVSSIVGVLNRAFSVGIVHNVDEAAKQADAVILLSLNSYSGTDYSKGVELIDAGFKAANEQGKGLLRYALNDTDWAAYQAARGSHQFAEPGRLQQVRVAGGVVAAQAEVKVDFKPIEGQPITAARIFNALKPIQSNGDYGASFETFSPPSGSALAGAAGSSSPRSKAPDTGVLVRLSQDPTGPLYLILGPEFAASTSSISRSELESRIVYQNLGGFGSELRATQQVGYLTHLTAEYYRLLTPKGYFLQPSAGFLREPVYIWSNQKRVAERLLQSYGTGIEFGRTIGYSTQISAEWRGEDSHWALTTGAGGGPYVSGTAQTSLLHINVDHETSGSVSPSGFRLSAAVGALYHAEASADAPLIEISTNHTWQWRGSNIFGLTGDLNSYMRANVAQPYRFTLGGPQRLSASAFDEYRGTDTYLVRAGFLHRMASLPTGLGHGLYTVCGYEAGEIWSPESHAILRQDGTLGILAATPLGSITLGGAVGDAGHRKIFITVGRLF